MASAPVSRSPTLKQERFCAAYIANGGNASQAYRDAYDAEKMSPEAIWVAASRLMDNPTVALRVAALQAEAAAAAGLNPAWVVSRWMRNADDAVAGDHPPQYAASNGALEALARVQRMAGYERREDAVVQVNVLAVQADALEGAMSLEEIRAWRDSQRALGAGATSPDALPAVAGDPCAT